MWLHLKPHLKVIIMGKRIIEIKGKNGTIYLYEDVSYRNKEKGYSTHDRTCIGIKGKDGKPVYNKYYKAREEIQVLTSEVNAAKATPRMVSSTTFVGETLILDKVSGETKIAHFLKASFVEDDANKIMALAYYQICRGKALSNAEDWLEQRRLGDLGLIFPKGIRVAWEIEARRNQYISKKLGS